MSHVELLDNETRDSLLRDYAAGDVSWRELREHGIESYREVLAGLGALGLRPPIAPEGGLNWEARQKGIAMVRASLQVPQRQ